MIEFLNLVMLGAAVLMLASMDKSLTKIADILERQEQRAIHEHRNMKPPTADIDGYVPW